MQHPFFALRVLLLAGLFLLPTPGNPAHAQTGITFSLANQHRTDAGFAFDVMVQAAEAGTRLGDTQVYLNYDEAAFGPSVRLHDRITATPTATFQATGTYRTPILNDNTATRVSITIEYQGAAEKGVLLPREPIALLHVVMALADADHPPTVSFDQPLMQGQQFESDQATAYTPVFATTTTGNSPNR